jgi:uncharacterized repeat protein (TIGR03803 family)
MSLQPRRHARLSLVAITLLLACATAFAQAEKVLHSFDGDDGNFPWAGVTIDAQGNLYGTTLTGGTSGAVGGTVFKMSPPVSGGAWSFEVIHDFDIYDDGYAPSDSPILDSAGNAYGTADYMVYELSPTNSGPWKESKLHSFDSYPMDGQSGLGLIFDPYGNLFGTTVYGGVYAHGTVFEMTAEPDGSWTERVIQSFDKANGDYPGGPVVMDTYGNLYGVTVYGGDYNGCESGCGLVYELSPNSDGTWTESVLHIFNPNVGDFIFPSGQLAFDSNGNLYGTASQGGPYGNGGIFELEKSAGYAEQILFGFGAYSTDGITPINGVVFDLSGNLYGVTVAGGDYSLGTAFKLTPATQGQWTETILHSFGSGLDGQQPRGASVDASGNVFGTTLYGGYHQRGIVFEITP